jgi:hypothetical protein
VTENRAFSIMVAVTKSFCTMLERHGSPEEVGGEGVAEGVTGHSFVEVGFVRSTLDKHTAPRSLVEMMPAAFQPRRFLVTPPEDPLGALAFVPWSRF